VYETDFSSSYRVPDARSTYEMWPLPPMPNGFE
jgi:hypothetical protein